MKFLPRRESRAERQAKAFKATENSTGKHQSAMDAIGRASIKDPTIFRGQVDSLEDHDGKITKIIDSNPSSY